MTREEQSIVDAKMKSVASLVRAMYKNSPYDQEHGECSVRYFPLTETLTVEVSDMKGYVRVLQLHEDYENGTRRLIWEDATEKYKRINEELKEESKQKLESVRQEGYTVGYMAGQALGGVSCGK